MIINTFSKVEFINEKWKSIPEFPNYQVSNLGRIRNTNDKHLSPWINNRGYLCIKLCKNRHRVEFKLHQLVALAFVEGKTDKKNEVHHKDFDKLNNRVENLEWCTRKKNMKYNYEKKKNQRVTEEVSGPF